MLDIPAGTVKWRVSEARKLLRAKLEGMDTGRRDVNKGREMKDSDGFLGMHRAIETAGGVGG